MGVVSGCIVCRYVENLCWGTKRNSDSHTLDGCLEMDISGEDNKENMMLMHRRSWLRAFDVSYKECGMSAYFAGQVSIFMLHNSCWYTNNIIVGPHFRRAD